jgi:stearoyl-CoA desaturase (delta-9 desaturase)
VVTITRKPGSIIWANTLFLVLSPIIGIALTIYHLKTEGFIPGIWIAAGIFYYLTGLAITGGYHRLFSHKTYEANSFVKFLYLIFGAAAFENTALNWSNDHRRHHQMCDTGDDPYNIKEGFFHAHMKWVMFEASYEPKHMVPDLEKDKLVMWQHKYYIAIGLFVGFFIPTLIGYYLGSALGGFAVIATLRTVFVQHCTFFINSWAHMWGKQTYTDTNTARDNFYLALFSYGEGYHNYHHFFQYDFRNGVKWFQFDPTKWLILSLDKIGWAWKLKRVADEEIFRAELTMQEKRVASKIVKSSPAALAFNQKIAQMKATMEIKLANMQALKKEYQRASEQLKLEKSQALIQRKLELKARIAQAKRDWRETYGQWQILLANWRAASMA